MDTACMRTIKETNDVVSKIGKSQPMYRVCASVCRSPGRLYLIDARSGLHQNVKASVQGMTSQKKLYGRSHDDHHDLTTSEAHQTNTLREFGLSKSTRPTESTVVASLQLAGVTVRELHNDIIDNGTTASVNASSAKVRIDPATKLDSKVNHTLKEGRRPISGAAVRRSRILQDQETVLMALKSFIEVSVLCGELTQAIIALRYYQKKLSLKCGNDIIKSVPTWIYNSLLWGYINKRDLLGVMMVKKLMVENRVAFDVTSCFDLFAVKIDRDPKLSSRLISAIFGNEITFKQRCQELVIDKIQSENIMRIIRKVKPDSRAPVQTYLEQYKCGPQKDLKSNKVSESSPEQDKIIPLNLLFEGAGEQWSRELRGIVKVKSITAVREPTPYVKFLRLQVEALEKEWADDLRFFLNKELRKLQSHQQVNSGMTLHPYLSVLDLKAVVALLLHEIRSIALSADTCNLAINQRCEMFGQQINDMYATCAKTRLGVTPKLKAIYNDYLKIYNLRSTRPERELWEDLLTQHSLWGPTLEELSPVPWPKSVITGVGRFLYQAIRNLQLDIDILKSDKRSGVLVNAIYVVFKKNGSSFCKREEWKPHPMLAKLYREAQLEDLRFDIKTVPMLSPPKPWHNREDSPFLVSQVTMIRAPNERAFQQDKSIRGDFYLAFDALNALSRCPWIINKPILQLITKVFLNNGDPKLGIPQPSGVLPISQPLNSEPKSEEHKATKELATYHRKCAEAYSLWCDMLYKLSIANHFKDTTFWFPYNLDFRGRAYPCSSYFNHIGNDVMRGCLMFAEGKPLGPNGLNWLKLHLINLTGFLKDRSISKKLKHVNEIIDDILDSADYPFTGKRWWQTSDEPWQTLAACKEVANALRCDKGPSEYVCHFPVHQDGSCNGLQHYAALGRDLQGAEQVNLRPMDLPQDVYSGIAEVVEQERMRDAEDGVFIARILEGYIKRKVVKQTVMTVVYGVTRYGSEQQILRQLQDLADFPQQYVHAAASYLAQKVLFSLREKFTATRQIQDWLANCAKLVGKIRGQPIDWITPLGLPVVQPYFLPVKKRSPVSFGENLYKNYVDFWDHSSKPNVKKQRNAFPPNFIHSIDSSHMMLTAIHSQAAGISFASVHDCFWTHPSTVETMNRLCREQFVALHSEPILENLSEYFVQRFGFLDSEVTGDDSRSDIVKKKFNEALRKVPPRGEFNLKEVLDSVYFFS
ncbi:DNA-directed RNA polymerase, mitochondrial-like [Varroa jacobsoni]|uniref:DNA-directed RNA polymerase, mitochondrial-like n=1 Tax=Varroa jacobsoni TaxID=62625 RepID=UPI000BF55D08|nr:DNA-directed RNA polymerase, mitochondrial-like [Varroa jacobsoni]XP_022702562.1 DNA-directed RNA polymerase, mitochondrial-like [Varroa jacobsoni]